MSQGPRSDRRSASSSRADDLGLPAEQELRDAVVPRLFVREPGWHVRLKVGSEKMFCYMMAPGEDHYHRIADGEIHLGRGDLRLCLPCADRHGLLQYEPRALRQPVRGLDIEGPDDVTDYPVREPSDRPLSEGAPDDLFLS